MKKFISKSDKKNFNTSIIINSNETTIDNNDQQIDFINQREYRNSINQKIFDSGKTISKFAEEIGLDASTLNKFLNCKRNLSKDNLICLGINLGYSTSELNEFLKCMGYELHARFEREFLIIQATKNNKSLYEIDTILIDKGYEPLRKFKINKEE